jgi:hypothetical protein
MFDMEFTMNLSDMEFILDISNRMHLTVNETVDFIKDITTNEGFWWWGNINSVCSHEEIDRYVKLADIAGYIL